MRSAEGDIGFMKPDKQQEQSAEKIINIYYKLGASNVIIPLLNGHSLLNYWQHYPDKDVQDTIHHTQYYYHSHPSKDEDRTAEHGHFHIFFREAIIPQGVNYIRASKKYIGSNGSRDKLTHLVAISMDINGKPKAFFTVNYWVTLGLWYPSSVLIDLLDMFAISIPASPYSDTNEWITAMINLFKAPIIDLLVKRDHVIEHFQKKHSCQDVFYDKRLEITSYLSL